MHGPLNVKFLLSSLYPLTLTYVTVTSLLVKQVADLQDQWLCYV